MALTQAGRVKQASSRIRPTVSSSYTLRTTRGTLQIRKDATMKKRTNDCKKIEEKVLVMYEFVFFFYIILPVCFPPDRSAAVAAAVARWCCSWGGCCCCCCWLLLLLLLQAGLPAFVLWPCEKVTPNDLFRKGKGIAFLIDFMS